MDASKKIKSPIGDLRLIAGNKGLRAILFPGDKASAEEQSKSLEDSQNSILCLVEKQLNEYFNGKRTSFAVPLEMQGTEFQKQVWRALLEIPFGETRSYGQIAQRIKNPKACRAVGAANGQNRIPIIVPCHRVIGADGSLTGFGGGIDTKKKLLQLENIL